MKLSYGVEVLSYGVEVLSYGGEEFTIVFPRKDTQAILDD